MCTVTLNTNSRYFANQASPHKTHIATFFFSAGLLAGAAVVFFAYVGFDQATCMGEECEKPERDLPRSIVATLLISTLLYVSVGLVLVGMVPRELIDEYAPVSQAFVYHNQKWLANIVSIGAVAGLLSVLMGSILGQPRILLAIARDGLLPQKVFGTVHPRFQTPLVSTVLTGTFIAVTSALVPLEVLVDLVSIGTLLAMLLVCASVVILRRRNPHAVRPYRVPCSPYFPVCGAAICFLLMLSLSWGNWFPLIFFRSSILFLFLQNLFKVIFLHFCISGCVS